MYAGHGSISYNPGIGRKTRSTHSALGSQGVWGLPNTYKICLKRKQKGGRERERQGRMILDINCLLLDTVLHKQQNQCKVESQT